MSQFNKTKEEIKKEYNLSVKTPAERFYFDKRNDNNTLLNDLYDRIEKEQGDLQFVYDVSNYIDELKDYHSRPYYN